MSLLGLGLAAAVATAPAPPPALEPWELAYYRHRAIAGVRCRYANGDRAVLLRTRNPRLMVFALMEDWRTENQLVAPLTFDRKGVYHYEINGGFTSYHMLDLAVDYMLQLPTRPVDAATFDRFVHDPHVPACKRKTYAADLYDKE